MAYKYTLEQLLSENYSEKMCLHSVLDTDETKKVIQSCMDNSKYFHQLFAFLIILWAGNYIDKIKGEKKYIDVLLGWNKENEKEKASQ